MPIYSRFDKMGVLKGGAPYPKIITLPLNSTNTTITGWLSNSQYMHFSAYLNRYVITNNKYNSISNSGGGNCLVSSTTGTALPTSWIVASTSSSSYQSCIYYPQLDRVILVDNSSTTLTFKYLNTSLTFTSMYSGTVYTIGYAPILFRANNGNYYAYSRTASSTGLRIQVTSAMATSSTAFDYTTITNNDLLGSNTYSYSNNVHYQIGGSYLRKPLDGTNFTYINPLTLDGSIDSRVVTYGFVTTAQGMFKYNKYTSNPSSCIIKSNDYINWTTYKTIGLPNNGYTDDNYGINPNYTQYNNYFITQSGANYSQRKNMMGIHNTLTGKSVYFNFTDGTEGIKVRLFLGHIVNGFGDNVYFSDGNYKIWYISFPTLLTYLS